MEVVTAWNLRSWSNCSHGFGQKEKEEKLCLDFLDTLPSNFASNELILIWNTWLRIAIYLESFAGEDSRANALVDFS